jgi:hypothetical protein
VQRVPSGLHIQAAPPVENRSGDSLRLLSLGQFAGDQLFNVLQEPLSAIGPMNEIRIPA